MLDRIKTLACSPWIRWPAVALAYMAAFMLVNPGIWSEHRFLGWDAVNEHWGALVYNAHYLETLSLPLWSPFERCGHPVLADPQTAVLYPLNYPIYLAVLLFGGGMWTILLKTLLHVAVAAVGIHYLLQRMQMPAAARWMGGLTFVLSARFIKAKDTSWIWSAAWLPWLFMAVDEMARRPSRRAGIGLGLAGAMCFLGGYTPNMFRNVLGLTPLFIAAVVAAHRQADDPWAYWRRLLKGLGLALLLFCGLAAPVVLATLDLFPVSTRDWLTREGVLDSPIFPRHLTSLVMPSMFKPWAFCYPYLGMLGALLAALACALRFRGQRLLWAVTAGVFFLLACGGNAFLLPALIQAVPGFDLWRVSTNYLFVTNFFLSLLAARGLTDLLTATPEQAAVLRRRAQVLVGAAGAVCLVGLGAATMAPDRVPDVLRSNAGTAVALAAICWLILLALTSEDHGTRRRTAWLALALLVVDVGLQLRPVAEILQDRPDLTREDTELKQLHGIRRSVRLAGGGYFPYRVGQRRKVRELFGWGNMLSIERYFNYVMRAERSYKLHLQANVRYYGGLRIELIKQQAGDHAKPVVGGIIEYDEYAPFAYWTDRVRVLPNPASVLNAMDRGQGKDIAIVMAGDVDAALLNRLWPYEERRADKKKKNKPPPAGRPAGWRAAATNIDLQVNSLAFTLDAPRAGVAVVHETYMHGWRATVDGKPARLFSVNYMFRGLLLPPGEHRIEMAYRPPTVLAGLAVHAATVLALLGAGLWWLVRRRGR
jgi:hypothetical protein